MAPDRNYFRDRTQQLEYRYKQAKANQLESKVDLRHDFTDMEAQIGRAKMPPSSPNVCPECWIMRHREVLLEPVASDDPSRFDRWICRAKDCGYSEDRRTGLK